MQDILIGAIPLLCNIVTIYYANNTTYINQQLLKVKNLGNMFQLEWAIIRPKTEQNSGTFSDGIP